MATIVLKFGGKAVGEPEKFSLIADFIMIKKLQYKNVAVVVSAMGDTTSRLIEIAKEVHPEPPRRELDMLVSVGERISISLLAMALHRKGQRAVSFTGSQTGIITCENHADASIVDVRPHRILPYLQEGNVVIVAGFQGVSRRGDITTLGRGGSDTTAVALGVALGAERVEFFKDVLGIYNSDPKTDPEARFFERLTYDEAAAIVEGGAKVLHKRCIQLAKANALPLFVRSYLEEGVQKGTMIEGEAVRHDAHPLYEVV